MVLAGQDLPDRPTIPTKEVAALRARLILEEALETCAALGFPDVEVLQGDFDLGPMHDEPDLVMILDGCADLSVVTIGTLSALGVNDEPLLALVDENNLAKEVGDL
jgi:predicted HAD superfamily Cof-like phosphohydrolase